MTKRNVWLEGCLRLPAGSDDDKGSGLEVRGYRLFCKAAKRRYVWKASYCAKVPVVPTNASTTGIEKTNTTFLVHRQDDTAACSTTFLPTASAKPQEAQPVLVDL